MEKSPDFESPVNKEKAELSFEGKLALADALLRAVDKRNEFVEGYGGFDTFAEAWQHVGDNRARYDRLDDAVIRARHELEEKVIDKEAFVRQLRNTGRKDFAERIERMFKTSSRHTGAPKGNILRFFRKRGKK